MLPCLNTVGSHDRLSIDHSSGFFCGRCFLVWGFFVGFFSCFDVFFNFVCVFSFVVFRGFDWLVFGFCLVFFKERI